MTTLVGGVGQLYQGDLDVGRVAVERLSAKGLGPGVVVEDLHYGAVAVAQRLDELRPSALVLVGAADRGRPPGTVERRWWGGLRVDPEKAQQAVANAVTGYVDIDLVLEVASALGPLPSRTVTVEVEPACIEASETLSDEATTALDQAVGLVWAEVRRAPLLDLADRGRDLLAENRLRSSPGLSALHELLSELQGLERHGTWGATFLARDRLRGHIARGETSDGMEHLDWVVWWALIEELDRVQALEVRADQEGLEGAV